MVFANVTDTQCELQIMWDNTSVSLPISTEVDSKVMKQIESTLLKDSRPYYAAAVYYVDNGKDLNQAVEWFNKAIEQNPKAFWVHYQKARALAKQGKKKEALEVSNKSMELAKEAQNDDYVQLNLKLQAELK
jgi:tetratricopeptide (TPR) repeat protein